MANSVYDFLDDPEYNFLDNLESECIYTPDENFDQDVTFSETLVPVTEEETVVEGDRKSIEEKVCTKDTERNRILSKEEAVGVSKTVLGRPVEKDVRGCERLWNQISKNIIDGKCSSTEEIEKAQSEQMKSVHYHSGSFTDSKLKTVSQDDIDTEPEDYSDEEEKQQHSFCMKPILKTSFVKTGETELDAGATVDVKVKPNLLRSESGIAESTKRNMEPNSRLGTSEIINIKSESDSKLDISKIINIKTEPDSRLDTSGVKIKTEPGLDLETLGSDNKKPVPTAVCTPLKHVKIKTEPGLDVGTSGMVQANFPVSLESYTNIHLKNEAKSTTTPVHNVQNKEDRHVIELHSEDWKPEAGVSINSEDEVIELAKTDVEEGEICNSDEIIEVNDSDVESSIKKEVAAPETSDGNYELISCSQKQKLTYVKKWQKNGCETEETIVKYKERRKKKHKKHKSQDRCSHCCSCKRRRECRSSSDEEWHTRKHNRHSSLDECCAHHSHVADKHRIPHSVSRRNCCSHRRKDHSVDDDKGTRKQTRNEKYDENKKKSVEKMRENDNLEKVDDRNDKYTRLHSKLWSDKNRHVRKDSHSDSDDSKRKKKIRNEEYHEDRKSCHKNVRTGKYADEQKEVGGKLEVSQYRNDEYKHKRSYSVCGRDEKRCTKTDSSSDSDNRRRKNYYLDGDDKRRKRKDNYYSDSDNDRRGRRKDKYYPDSDDDRRRRRKDNYYSDSDDDRKRRRKDNYYLDNDNDRRKRKDNYFSDTNDDRRRRRRDYHSDSDDDKRKRKDKYFSDSDDDRRKRRKDDYSDINDNGRKSVNNEVDIKDEEDCTKSAEKMEIVEEDSYWEEDVYWQSECRWIKKNYIQGPSWLTDPPKEAELYRLYLNLEHKHPVQALTELCNKRKWSCPEFAIVMEMGPSHQKLFWYKVTVQGKDYTAPCYTNSKKEGKAIAAAKCLQDLNIISSEKLTDIIKKSGKCVDFNHEEGKTESSTAAEGLPPNIGPCPSLKLTEWPQMTPANTMAQITNWTQMSSAQGNLLQSGQVSGGVSQAYQWTHKMIGGQVTNWSQWQQ